MSTREKQHELANEYNELSADLYANKKTLTKAEVADYQARMREITDYLTNEHVGFHNIVLGKGAAGIALDRNEAEEATYQAAVRQHRVETRYDRLRRNTDEYRAHLQRLVEYAQEELRLLDYVDAVDATHGERIPAEALRELKRVATDQWSSSAALALPMLSASIKAQCEDMLVLDHNEWA